MKTRYVTVKYPIDAEEGITITDVNHYENWFDTCNEDFPFGVSENPQEDEEFAREQYDDNLEPIAVNVIDKFLVLTYAFNLKESK